MALRRVSSSLDAEYLGVDRLPDFEWITLIFDMCLEHTLKRALESMSVSDVYFERTGSVWPLCEAPIKRRLNPLTGNWEKIYIYSLTNHLALKNGRQPDVRHDDYMEVYESFIPRDLMDMLGTMDGAAMIVQKKILQRSVDNTLCTLIVMFFPQIAMGLYLHFEQRTEIKHDPLVCPLYGPCRRSKDHAMFQWFGATISRAKLCSAVHSHMAGLRNFLSPDKIIVWIDSHTDLTEHGASYRCNSHSFLESQSMNLLRRGCVGYVQWTDGTWKSCCWCPGIFRCTHRSDIDDIIGLDLLEKGLLKESELSRLQSDDDYKAWAALREGESQRLFSTLSRSQKRAELIFTKGVTGEEKRLVELLRDKWDKLHGNKAPPRDPKAKFPPEEIFQDGKSLFVKLRCVADQRFYFFVHVPTGHIQMDAPLKAAYEDMEKRASLPSFAEVVTPEDIEDLKAPLDSRRAHEIQFPYRKVRIEGKRRFQNVMTHNHFGSVQELRGHLPPHPVFRPTHYVAEASDEATELDCMYTSREERQQQQEADEDEEDGDGAMQGRRGPKKTVHERAKFRPDWDPDLWTLDTFVEPNRSAPTRQSLSMQTQCPAYHARRPGTQSAPDLSSISTKDELLLHPRRYSAPTLDFVCPRPDWIPPEPVCMTDRIQNRGSLPAPKPRRSRPSSSSSSPPARPRKQARWLAATQQTANRQAAVASQKSPRAFSTVDDASIEPPQSPRVPRRASLVQSTMRGPTQSQQAAVSQRSPSRAFSTVDDASIEPPQSPRVPRRASAQPSQENWPTVVTIMRPSTGNSRRRTSLSSTDAVAAPRRVSLSNGSQNRSPTTSGNQNRRPTPSPQGDTADGHGMKSRTPKVAPVMRRVALSGEHVNRQQGEGRRAIDALPQQQPRRQQRPGADPRLVVLNKWCHTNLPEEITKK